MSGNITPNITIFEKSRTILVAQEATSIVWATLSVLGFIISVLQLITTAFWKPLRKAEQTLISAIAIADLLKCISFGILALRRLYKIDTGGDDVATQRDCLVWIFFMEAPNNTGRSLTVAISCERLVALAAPIWYKVQQIGFRLYLIGVSVAVALVLQVCIFVGSSATLVLPACSFGSATVEAYRNWAVTIYQYTTTYLIVLLNLISCVILGWRWRKAIKDKKNMKTFKKSVHLSALKTLLVVVTTYLVSSGMGAIWTFIINSGNWDEAFKTRYQLLGGCFTLLRSVFDFPCYIMMAEEYRKGFEAVILKKLRCWETGEEQVIDIAASASSSHVPKPDKKNPS